MRADLRTLWTVRALVFASVTLAVPGPGAAASLCAKLRYRAAAVAANAMATCHAKAAGAGTEVDPSCLASAGEKLAHKWAKAAAKGDCPTAVDAATAQGIVDGFIAALTDVLEPPTVGHCCATTSSCVAGPSIDQAACDQFSGTLGAPGSVCGATGACVAPPGAGGTCCTIAQSSICLAGPGITQAGCSAAGGFDIPNGVCQPSGTCTFQ